MELPRPFSFVQVGDNKKKFGKCTLPQVVEPGKGVAAVTNELTGLTWHTFITSPFL